MIENMKTRFTLYGFGFAIGLVLVFFFLGGKNASCNWMPNDRILNIIAQKKIRFADEVKETMVSSNIDSLDVMQILINGEIDFSKSIVKNEPCRNYWIEGKTVQKELVITVELCDSLALVKTLKRIPKN
jgi:hypothetical protein